MTQRNLVRHDPGSPGGTGGQFKEHVRSEAPHHLDDRGATFDFPPYPANEDQVVDFWLNVDIPERRLAHASRRYREIFEKDRRAKIDEWVQKHPAPVDPTIGQTASSPGFAERKERWKADLAEWGQAKREAEAEARVDLGRPAKMPPEAVRSAVRLTRISQDRYRLEQRGEPTTPSMEFVLPDGTRTTTHAMLRQWGINRDEWVLAMTEDIPDHDTQEVVEAVRTLTKVIGGALSEQTEHIVTGNQVAAVGVQADHLSNRDFKKRKKKGLLF